MNKLESLELDVKIARQHLQNARNMEETNKRLDWFQVCKKCLEEYKQLEACSND